MTTISVASFNRDFAVDRETFGFLGTQSNLTTIADLAAAGAFKFTDFVISPRHQQVIDEEHRPGRDRQDYADGPKGPHEIDLTLNFSPSGTAGTVTDVDEILLALFTKTTRAAVTMDSGAPSTTSFGTTDSGILLAGDVIFIPTSLGADTVEMAVVSSVSTVSSVDTVTLKWALSFTPASNTVIAASLQYAPRNDVDNTKYLTMYRATNVGIEAVSGVQPVDFSVTGNRGELTKLNIKLIGRHHFGAGQTTLNGGINDAVTTMTVDDGNRFFGLSASQYLYAVIDEGTATEEKVKLTGNSGNNLTIVRAGSPFAHIDGAVVDIYIEDPTLTGSPVSGVFGDVWLQGTKMRAQEFNFATNEGFAAIEEYGDQELTEFHSGAHREPSFNANLVGHKTSWDATGLGPLTTEAYFGVQFGADGGSVGGVYCGLALMEGVSIPSAPNDKVMVPVQTQAILGTGDTAFRFAIG